jgi:hypothetical protein
MRRFEEGAPHFFDETKKAFLGWDDVLEPWDFSSCEAYIEWCHISRESHITATTYIATRTRPICIIANGPFSRKGV